MTKRKPTYDITTSDGQKRLMYESAGLPYVSGPVPIRSGRDYGTNPHSATHVELVPSGRIVTLEEARRILGR